MIYNNFASVYDKLMEHAPYDEWVKFTEDMISLHEKEVTTIVDLGCGTGSIPIKLASLGYKVTGVDSSSEMLTQAFNRAIKEKVEVNWIHQDIRHLEGFDQIDLCISYCDVINYIIDERDIASVFKNVYNSLSSTGLFIFDIHSLFYVKNSLINYTFAEATDELAYIWECEAGEHDGEIFHHLTFFKRESEYYTRFDELHHQRTYELSVYENLLKICGFSKIYFYGDFLKENIISEKNTDRIFIVAEK